MLRKYYIKPVMIETVIDVEVLMSLSSKTPPVVPGEGDDDEEEDIVSVGRKSNNLSSSPFPKNGPFNR